MWIELQTNDMNANKSSYLNILRRIKRLLWIQSLIYIAQYVHLFVETHCKSSHTQIFIVLWTYELVNHTVFSKVQLVMVNEINKMLKSDVCLNIIRPPPPPHSLSNMLSGRKLTGKHAILNKMCMTQIGS